jgi:hypothetical protein
VRPMNMWMGVPSYGGYLRLTNEFLPATHERN